MVMLLPCNHGDNCHMITCTQRSCPSVTLSDLGVPDDVWKRVLGRRGGGGPEGTVAP